MKILHKGYVYESIYQTDLFLNDADAKKKYEEHLEDQAVAEIAENGTDDIEEDLSQTKASIPVLLKKWNLKGYAVNNDYVFEEAGGYFIIRNREVISVERLIDDPKSYYKEFPELANLEQKISDDFWKYPETLYHATNCDNVEEIKIGGLYPGWGTGMSNRHVHGVFTSTEQNGYIDSYGECKFAVDTAKMKQNGDTPLLTREPEVFDYMVSQIIGNVYGISVDRHVDSSGGVDMNTWIIDSHISPEYLTLVEGGDSEEDY